MGDGTFELFMLIFNLIMTPLMKDGCWVPLFCEPLKPLLAKFCAEGYKVRGIKQVRSKPGGSYYLFWVQKCKIRKTWTVAGFQELVQRVSGVGADLNVWEFENGQYVPAYHLGDEKVSENCIVEELINDNCATAPSSFSSLPT